MRPLRPFPSGVSAMVRQTSAFSFFSVAMVPSPGPTLSCQDPVSRALPVALSAVTRMRGRIVPSPGRNSLMILSPSARTAV